MTIEDSLRAIIREELQALRVPVMSLSVEDAATALKVSPGMVRKEIREGRLRAFRVGTKTRVAVEEIHAYAARGAVGPAA